MSDSGILPADGSLPADTWHTDFLMRALIPLASGRHFKAVNGHRMYRCSKGGDDITPLSRAEHDVMDEFIARRYVTVDGPTERLPLSDRPNEFIAVTPVRLTKLGYDLFNKIREAREEVMR